MYVMVSVVFIKDNAFKKIQINVKTFFGFCVHWHLWIAQHLLDDIKCQHHGIFCPLSTQMSLVDLGKRLLEAARNGHDDEVRTLMANGAPFTTDWVCHICIT